MKKSCLHSRKIGGTADYIIPLGVVGLGVFALYKFGLIGGSGTAAAPGATTANNASTTAANQSATTATAAANAAAGITPTMSAIAAQGVASQIYTAGTADTPDLNAIQSLLMQPLNIADLNQIIQYFGTKNVASSTSIFNMCYQYGYNCTAVDLSAFVNMLYANQPGSLASINSYYTLQGINFQF
jgi:hypothetical protein